MDDNNLNRKGEIVEALRRNMGHIPLCDIPKMNNAAADLIEALSSRVSTLENERKLMLPYFAACEPCEYCAHAKEPMPCGNDIKRDCGSCDLDCCMNRCEKGNEFAIDMSNPKTLRALGEQEEAE